MTKADLVDTMAKATGESKSSAERALNEFVTSVVESLRRGRHVTITGFGTFIVVRRAARTVKNPRNGKTMSVPAARVPRFRPSRSVKAAFR